MGSKEIDKIFNYAAIQPYLIEPGQSIHFESGSVIVERGYYTESIYFIKEGVAIGQRNYSDGNQFNYFQINKDDGSIGLLEILSKQDRYVATVTSLSDVEAIRVPAKVVYETIMTNIELLKMCVYLVSNDLYQRSANDGLYYYYSGIDRLRLWLTDYYRMKVIEQQTVTVKHSYDEIASQIGISPRTVGRSISQLKQSNEVAVQGKRISLNETNIININQTLLSKK